MQGSARYHRSRSRRRRLEMNRRCIALVSLVMIAFAGFISGCMMIQNVLGVEDQLARTRSLSRVQGQIDVEGGATGTLVVVIGTPAESEGGKITGVDSYVRVRAGSYAFPVNPGRYVVGAFEDRNHALSRWHYDHDDRGILSAP